MMLCIVAGGQAEKSNTKTSNAKTTQAKSKNSQSSRNSQNTQKKSSQKERLQAQKRQLQKNISANKTKKAALEKQVKEQLEAVFILGGEIDEKKRTIDTIRVGLDSLDAQLVVLERQLNRLQGELTDRQQRYTQSVRYMHRNNKMQSKMMFIFSAKNINQMYRRTRFMKEYATYQRAQGEAVKQKQVQVEQKRQELEASKQEKTALLARGEREQKSLEEQQNRKQQMAQELQKQQRMVATLIMQQQQQETELNRRIDQMIAEEIARENSRLESEERNKEQEQQNKEREKRLADAKAREEKAKADEKAAKTAEEKAKARRQAKNAEKERKTAEHELAEGKKRTTRGRKSSDANYTAADPNVRLTGSFASNKGRLPMPITGAYQIVRSFGSNVVDGARGVHLSSKGIYLKGQPGAQARCVFDGEVSKIFSTGTSYIIMVRHGRYISVYSDLASVSVSAGQKVSTNQTLGKLGSSNIMQFQLRNWTELLNPRSWLRRK